MDTPRARSPRPLPPRSSKPSTAPLPPPPPPRPPLSAATSPSRDFSFAAFSSSASSSPFGGHHLHPLSMSRTPVVGRVGSDLSHNNYAKTSRHPTTSCRNDGGDRAKIRASPFISGGIGGAWRKESSSGSDTTGSGGKPAAEERRKEKLRRGLDVSQWVRKRVAAMVEQLRASFSRQAERERREQQRRRPHSFSGHGPNAAAREIKEQGRWMRRRRGQLSSAPASLRVSPANSGHLSVGASVKVSTSSEESTMEELQSAIEAAIAHCKNSISRGQQADDVDGRRGDRTKIQ
ncbi:hypothetical protein EJB05_56041, partial [Eragrostis curvula]